MTLAKLVALVALGSALWGCEQTQPQRALASATEPSPNASILPQPLASAELGRRDAGRDELFSDASARATLPEASTPPPEPIREEVALRRDTLSARDTTGATLEARFNWSDLPAHAGVPEVNADAIAKARDKTALALTIDLAAAGRMRFELSSPTFVLPKQTALRASLQYYGHLIVWPDATAYRVLLPGTLRALLAERRVDVTPLSEGKTKPVGHGNFLGLETTRTEIKGPLGTVVLEQATQPIAGPSGMLLCRLLIELVAVDPQSTVCSFDMTPLKAEFRWLPRGRMWFEVHSLTRRSDLSVGQLMFPPASAELKRGELPPQTSSVLLTQAELISFRRRADSTAESEKDAPAEGIVGVNRSDVLRYLLLDGVPVAWLRPKGEQHVIGPQPGRYAVSWRDFLGTEIDPPKTIALPARVIYGGEPDAGAPRR